MAIISLGGQKTMMQRFLDLEAFATEAEAVQRAREAGMDWVDAHRKVNESVSVAPAGRIVNLPI